jgi:uncharacterized membrane protein YkoI
VRTMKHTSNALLSAAALLFATLPACKSHGGHEKEEAEVAVKQQPATSLAAAIATAQKSEPGAHFRAAEIENEGGKVICSIVLVKGAAAREVNIDATSGAILATENEKVSDKTQKLMAELEKNPAAAPINVGQAIEAALKKVPGSWAMAAEFGREEGALVYDVVLAGGHEPMVARISALDGSVKKVSEMEEEEDEKGEAKEENEEKGEAAEKH